MKEYRKTIEKLTISLKRSTKSAKLWEMNRKRRVKTQITKLKNKRRDMPYRH
jgi:hypothetical protein